jgi:hypothetical protein
VDGFAYIYRVCAAPVGFCGPAPTLVRCAPTHPAAWQTATEANPSWRAPARPLSRGPACCAQKCPPSSRAQTATSQPDGIGHMGSGLANELYVAHCSVVTHGVGYKVCPVDAVGKALHSLAKRNHVLDIKPLFAACISARRAYRPPLGRAAAPYAALCR